MSHKNQDTAPRRLHYVQQEFGSDAHTKQFACVTLRKWTVTVSHTSSHAVMATVNLSLNYTWECITNQKRDFAVPVN